jgi:hypothetical protein
MKTISVMLLLAACGASAQLQPAISTRAGIARDLFAQTPTPGTRPLLFTEEEGSVRPEKKSVGTAVLYSFLLPGMGELYAGKYDMGKYFTIAEGTLWIALFGVDRYAHWLQDDARQYAAQHAGISVSGKDEQYFIDIGNDSDVYAYNQRILQNRDQFKIYNEAPNSPDLWKWDTETSRSTYRDQRVSSNEMFNNTRFVAAVIAVNHIVSAINAARLTISYNKSVDHADLIDVRARLLGTLTHPDGMMVTVSKSF